MYHYKDSHPIQTVNRIRHILEGLEIMPTEERWINNQNQSYSVRLVINGTKIGVNGKGITPELALASAYAEFMERLQNQLLYPLFTYQRHDTALQMLNGFCSSPDEVYLSVSELMEKTDHSILENIFPVDLDEGESPDEYVRALSISTLHPDTGKLLCIPYYCINTDSLVYLPRNALICAYGTNGMCAGNTPEEALVQGLCEIIERYTNKMIVVNNLAPPEIPREYYSHFEQAELLKSLEKNKIIKCFVKDASLGEKLPAVCMAVINRALNKYFVKFASHIEFEVALERTLIELFQGRTIERLEKGDFMAPFVYLLDESYKTEENLSEIFGTGEGKYNNDFFGNLYSYPPNEEYYGSKNLKSNKEYLRYLVKSLLKKRWHILVRDVSFLGFPAFHVIIPGVSELQKFDKKNCIDANRKVRIAELLQDINTCTDKELREIAQFVEGEIEKYEHGSIADLTGVAYLEEFPWKKIRFNLFLCMLYLRIGDFKRAHFFMRRYISEIEETDIVLEAGGLEYYKCAGDYLALLTENGIENEEITEKVEILKQIYGDESISHVLESVRPEKAFQVFEKLECPACPQCTLREFCFYEKIRDIHTQVKNAIAQNVIDQLRRNREFWSGFV